MSIVLLLLYIWTHSDSSDATESHQKVFGINFLYGIGVLDELSVARGLIHLPLQIGI